MQRVCRLKCVGAPSAPLGTFEVMLQKKRPREVNISVCKTSRDIHPVTIDPPAKLRYVTVPLFCMLNAVNVTRTGLQNLILINSFCVQSEADFVFITLGTLLTHINLYPLNWTHVKILLSLKMSWYVNFSLTTSYRDTRIT